MIRFAGCNLDQSRRTLTSTNYQSMASTSPSSSSAPRSKGKAKRAGNSGCEGGTPPEMDKLLPSLPKDPIAEYSSIATCTPDDDITWNEKIMGATNAITTTEQRGPFCSPAPPPFPFSLSYSSKSDSSGEKTMPGKKNSRNKKGGNKKRTSSRSKKADTRTPPSASSASSSEDPRASVARHPGQPSTNYMQRDGKFQSPAEDPMFAALFASHHSDEIMASTASSALRSYASPNATKSHTCSDLQVGKVVTEEETSPPSDGASKSDSQPKQYEGHAETPSKGVNLGSSPYHHLSPGHPYYQFPPPAQYFQPSGPGVDDAYHYHQGYQGYDPYSSSAGHPPVDGHGTIYDGYYPYNTEYYAGPYPGDEYVGNHEEAFYQQLPGLTDRSPGKVSHSSSQSHSPGGTFRHTKTPKKRQASSASVGDDSPYEAMPQLSSATRLSAGSPPPAKKQRVLSSAWTDRFSELLEYKKANGDCNVPQKYPDHPALGIWVNKQRMEYKLYQEGKKTSMTLERVQKLEAAGFQWAKRKGAEAWEAKFEELVQYREEHGDCQVPTKYPENKALGRWVSTQRAQYKLWEEGKKRACTLTKDRVKRLNKLGFVWRLQS